jgi:hypothetical protein
MLAKALAAVDVGDMDLHHTALSEACRLAKQIGLHLEIPSVGKDISTHEPLLVFWNLYVLDKLDTLRTGRSCLLPSSDCGATLPNLTNDDSTAYALLTAGVNLASIQEDIYHKLHSIEARRKLAQERRQAIVQISMRLQEWRTQHHAITQRMHHPASSSGKPHMQMSTELYLTYMTCCILVEQSSVQLQHDRSSLLNMCREHLRLVETLISGGDDRSVHRCDALLSGQRRLLSQEITVTRVQHTDSTIGFAIARCNNHLQYRSSRSLGCYQAANRTLWIISAIQCCFEASRNFSNGTRV